jgi:predicted DCC family thiol-disulfide oxidoreductase YuxK
MLDKILVFDGVCVLCSRGVRFVLRRDQRREYRFAAMQTQSGRRMLVEHGVDPDNPVSFLLLDGGSAYSDTDAVIRVLHSLGGVWTLLALLVRLVPRFIRDRLYRFLARRRYRLFGQRADCLAPTPDVADRFLH